MPEEGRGVSNHEAALVGHIAVYRRAFEIATEHLEGCPPASLEGRVCKGEPTRCYRSVCIVDRRNIECWRKCIAIEAKRQVRGLG